MDISGLYRQNCVVEASDTGDPGLDGPGLISGDPGLDCSGLIYGNFSVSSSGTGGVNTWVFYLANQPFRTIRPYRNKSHGFHSLFMHFRY